MAATQPAFELQQQPSHRDHYQQQAGESDFSSHAGTAQTSMETGPPPTSTGRDASGSEGNPRSIQVEAWSTDASSTPFGQARPTGTEPEPGHGDPRWLYSQSCQPPPNNRPQPPIAPRASHRKHVLRYWALEIVMIFLAVCLIAAIIALLAHYDGRYMPEWPLTVSLNTIIAFLATFLRSAMAAAVAEIIGQIKWTWFTERTRPLHHLQDFDSASRSVIGSFRLLGVVLWNLGFTSAGMLGMGAAMVTIASLGVGPLVQQCLRTASCPQLAADERASVPVANFAPGMSSYYRTGPGMYEIEVDMKSTIIQGLTDPGGDENNVDITCGSGNCTWPDYGTGVTHSSIGLCSACIDTTDYVTGPDSGGNITLPDKDSFINYSLGGQYMWIGYSNLTWASGSFTEDFATAAGIAINNFSMLITTKSPCTYDAAGAMTCPHRVSQSNADYFKNLGDYIAASCTLYPCMKDYYGVYSKGVYTEKIVRTQPALPNKLEAMDSYSSYYNYTALQLPCVLDNGTWYDDNNITMAQHVPNRTWSIIPPTAGYKESGLANISVPNACLYKMDGVYASALSSFMQGTIFSGNCDYETDQAGHINCRDAWWLTPLWANMHATFDGVNAAIHAFATAVTNKLRMTGAGPNTMLGQKPQTELVYGLVYETSRCTYFDRQWLWFPILLVVACGILLACIAIKNYRDPEQPVWKGSVLPLMFFGLHSTVAPAGGESRALGDKHRLERNATFLKQDGRAAPELERIQDEAGRMHVRFHGGVDPGFVDLGMMSKNDVRDAESRIDLLNNPSRPGKRESQATDSEYDNTNTQPTAGGRRPRSRSIL